jgi:hypothetical protein
MANPIKSPPLGWANSPITDKAGMISRGLLAWLTKAVTPATQVIQQDGSIHPDAPIGARTDGIGTTVQNLNATGQLASTDHIAADGAGSPLTGGMRAAIALNSDNRLANSFRANAVNLANVPTSATVLSNNGVSTAIPVAASTNQFGTAAVSYNSGTVDPGVFGTFYVYADDPKFAGGAVNYQFTANPAVLVAADGRINFGKITTVGGSAKTGGGNTGGTTPGGTGGRGVNLG